MHFGTEGKRRGGGSACGRTARVLVAGLVGALVGGTPSVAANEFPINACQADRINYSTQAFEDFATRGMLWRRACNPEGPGLRGLVTANVVRPGRIKRGARSLFVLRAPPGTHFTTFVWSGSAVRTDCRYALQLWAYGPDGPTAAIKNVRANHRCTPAESKTQIAGWPSPRAYDVRGATSIVQRVVCMGDKGEPYCSSRARNYLRTFTAQALVADVTPPAVSIVPNNPFTRGAWVSGAQSVTYQRVGQCWGEGSASRSRRQSFEASTRGDATSLSVCRATTAPGAIQVDTTALSEGSQALSVQAYDAAENAGTSGAVTVRVDNTAPGAVPVAVEGGEGWRNQNNFDLIWANPNEGDRAPIVAAHYRLCRAGGAECATRTSSAPGIARIADIAVPGPGEWQARVWREDAAANRQPENASVPVTMRFDPEPPQLGFEPPSAGDPTLVSVAVTDKVSGLAGGQIEVSRQGSGSWQALATVRSGSRLVARIDDARLPAGAYLLRATARDQAANQNSTDKLLDGRPMVINLPLRVPTLMRAGLLKKRTGRREREPCRAAKGPATQRDSGDARKSRVRRQQSHRRTAGEPRRAARCRGRGSGVLE